MKAASFLLHDNHFVSGRRNGAIDENTCQLVLGLGDKLHLADPDSYRNIRAKFPSAHIALCSTAGEIFDAEVSDHTLSLIAFEFSHTTIKPVSININQFRDSYSAGEALVNLLPPDSLHYIFVLSDGSLVNGSELVRGMNHVVGKTIPITGGLAGDATDFASTLVGLNEPPSTGTIIAIGFYGNRLKVSHGSKGGWDVFGLERRVTKSIGNVLYQIDGKEALTLYKEYLGKYANELPASALLFPLSIKLQENSEPIVRTILGINNEDQSMVFAGDVPEGARIRFMKANFDKLIDAAVAAAHSSAGSPQDGSQKVAILISCVGRKLVLGKRVEEEVEAVRDTLAPDVLISGFYSYGEISPSGALTQCELHNQTMTITTFEEI